VQVVEVHGCPGRADVVAIAAQQAGSDEVSDRAIMGVGLSEVLVVGKYLATQLPGAEDRGVHDQDVQEHGDLPGLVGKIFLTGHD
jgi:hypothetical protein